MIRNMALPKVTKIKIINDGKNHVFTVIAPSSVL